MDEIQQEMMRECILNIREAYPTMPPNDNCPFGGVFTDCSPCAWLFPNWAHRNSYPYDTGGGGMTFDGHPCSEYFNEYVINRVNDKLNIKEVI